MKTLVVIPCRYNSARLIEKHLHRFSNGKTLMQMTYERVIQSNAQAVVIAVDDQRLYDQALLFGAKVQMTLISHTSGSDRVNEVACAYPDFECIINVQGDEPLISPTLINALIDRMLAGCQSMCSVMTPFASFEEVQATENVKVVVDKAQRALYFSRFPIPFVKGAQAFKADWVYKHVGVYAYRRALLSNFVAWERGHLEQAESLEQLRVLENGYAIDMLLTEDVSIGVDTKADVNQLEAIIQENRHD